MNEGKPRDSHALHHAVRQAAAYRAHDPAFSQWANGTSVVTHRPDTQVHVFRMACDLEQRGLVDDKTRVFHLLRAADQLTQAAMWLVVHMTYAARVHTDGRPLQQDAFKSDPQGHTGGALNMVPAYIGYLTANALSGLTRGWLMGQGHAVAAIDSCNVLVNNMTTAHAERYDWSDTGLTRFVRDFYSYQINADGSPASPLGSHVNVNTAGGMHEGGYLGFAELEYVHMPLSGERLVAFLSDGAFEEQRGSDWAPRWWRAEDSGLVTPIMIANGRRIEQRSTLFQQGGVAWFAKHLRLNGFDPLLIDGTDPAAFAWSIIEAEARLEACADAIRAGSATYPVPLHYVIAEAPKGYGFPGSGTNRAHNLPLSGNPALDVAASKEFNEGAQRLHVSKKDIEQACDLLNGHIRQDRPREKDHPLSKRDVHLSQIIAPEWKASGDSVSPMSALDEWFVRLVMANTALRVRVGNPDELRSNRFGRTLDTLKHRVFIPEPGNPEAVDGSIITALNEEAVACAAFGNKGGINLVVSYEAFAAKMLGVIRQELIFARHQKDGGRPAGWLSVPLLLTSHTWESGKNEQSHQDPTLCEALLGEMSDVSIVRFPVDANSAQAALADCYSRSGEVHALVVPKGKQPVCLSPEQSDQLVRDGALRLAGTDSASIRLVAVGAYQLRQCRYAWDRLTEHGVEAALFCLFEPGRFRAEFRDTIERDIAAPAAIAEEMFSTNNRDDLTIIVSHTRPEAIHGLLAGRGQIRVLGYRNRGGTLDTAGMLYANRCSWLHVLEHAATSLGVDPAEWLNPEEQEAIAGRIDPRAIIDTGGDTHRD